MEVDLAYDNKKLVVKIPKNMVVDSYAPARERKPVSRDSFLGKCENADLAPLFAAERPLIIVNDAYRNTPTGLILKWLAPAHPAFLERCRFLVATGAHEKPADGQLGNIFGPVLQRIRKRVSSHDARCYEAMTRLGVDSLGGDVWINSEILQADRVLVIGSVEPHYFAGFTGGRKALFPGACDLATIERNHNLANSLEASPLALAGNPVAEHLEELMRFVNDLTVNAIQVVTDREGDIAGAFVGPLDEAFASATDLARKLYAHKVACPYDAVLCEMLPPLDSNLYQAQKALENSRAAIAAGGSGVVISACREGIGSDHFFELADQWDRDINVPLQGKPRFGSHKLSRVIDMTRRFDVRLHSELSNESARRVFYEPLDDISDFLQVKAKTKETFRLAVVHDAGHTVLTAN